MQATPKPSAGRSSGILLILVSAAAFGALPIFAYAAYRSGVDPVSVLFLRFSMAALLMAGWLRLRGRHWPRGKTLLLLIGMGALGYAGQSFSYFTALTMAPAGTVALMLYTFPALVTMLSVAVLRHPLQSREAVALGLAFAGIMLVVGFQPGGQGWGIFWALLAALIYSAYIIAGTAAVRRTESFTAAAVIIAAAAATYGGVALHRGLLLPQTAAGWGAVVCIAVVSTVLAIATFFAGLKRIGPVQASMLSMAEPVVTLALSCLLLAERLTAAKLAGGLLVIIAGLLLACKPKANIELAGRDSQV